MGKLFKKVLKYVAIAAGVFFLLLGLAAGYFAINYPPAKLKAMATEQLSKTLKRKVDVGDVRFNIFSGIKIKDLRISNRPGWTNQDFVTAKEISISYNLFPLIWGQLSLGQVKLNAPEILIERRGLSNFNFSDMADDATAALFIPVTPSSFSFVSSAEAAPAPDAAKPNKTLMLFSIESVNISHGKLVYLDDTSKDRQRFDLNDLNFVVHNISLVGGKSTFTLDAPVSANKFTYKLSIAGSYRYFISSQSVKELQLKGTVNDLGFGLSGNALNMSTNFAPDMDGEASLEILKLSGLLPTHLSSMPDGLNMSGPAKVDFHLNGTLKDGFKLTGTANGDELAIKYKDIFVKTAKTPCKVQFKSSIWQDGSFDLPMFKVLYDKWEVDGAFHNKKGSSWSCDVHSKSLPFGGIPAMLPKFSKTKIDGAGVVDLVFRQSNVKTASFFVNGTVVLKGVGITLPQEPYLQDMNGTIYCVNNIVRAPSIAFKSFDGAGATGVTVNLGTDTYSYGFNLKSVNAQKAIDASIDAYVTTKNYTSYKDKLYGTMNFVYSGSGKGFSGDAMLASQVGSGKYDLVNAKLKGFDAIKTVNSYFKDKSDEIQFEKIDGNLSLKNSVISYTANNTGKVGAIRVTGAINMNTMAYSPDMKVRADIKQSFVDSDAVKNGLPAEARGLAKESKWITDKSGNIPIDYKFTGVVSENHYSWDTDRLIAVVKENAAKAIGEALKGKQGDIGNAIKGLFGK